MDLSTNGLAKSVIRLGQAAQNALEVARFGGLDTGEEPTAHEVVSHHRVYRLRRYLHDDSRRKRRPPILLVPPMMLAADVWDVSPQTSAVSELAKAGIDPWVIDFGSPEKEEGGLERTLTDHVVALSNAVDEVIETTGGPVHLAGYSQGGMFCYQTAAYRRAEGLASIITFGSPVDAHAQLPMGIDDETLVNMLDFLADSLGRFPIPAWMSRAGFRMMDPVRTIQQQLEFLLQLHNREALLPREGQRRFLMDEGWVAWPGPAIAELIKQFVVSNRMVSGGFVIDGRPVTLADVSAPILCFVGTKDDIAPANTVRAVASAAHRADIYESTMEAGHFGLVVGSKSVEHTWPTVAEWIRWQDGSRKTQPANIRRLTLDDLEEKTSTLSDLERGFSLATNIATGVLRTVANGTRRSAETIRDLAVEAIDQLPRMSRLEQVRPSSHISLGSLLDEQAKAAPNDIVFLFDGRAHTYRAANERIDNVVRGLLSLGVRRGEHVGVLMDTRPSALGVVAALNRLGSVAVMLRPDGFLEREIELGAVTRIVADPEHGDQAAAATRLPTHVLGGGGASRDLGSSVDDMERIDPAAVPLPGWYEANPGRGRDLAFILFTGAGERTRVSRVTNARWALSAFGTATAGSLTRADTVLCLTPIHHPSALLTGIGGAIASRARLSLNKGFERETFWDDVRRSGATAVTYTWTMVADMLDAPDDLGNVPHPIRVFLGSGMPKGIWRRAEQRFAPAKVVEFYAATESDAVLVNLSNGKIGSIGRRLPGSAALKIAKYDVDAGRLVEGRDGFAVECRNGEVGMLLARIDPRMGSYPDGSLRAMFEGDDAWLATGDLLRRDADGDHWLVGGVSSLIRTPDGAVAPIPVQDALTDADAVHLSAAYGVVVDGVRQVAAAVALRHGAALDPVALSRAVSSLPPAHRPRFVRVVDDIPRTTWYRVRTDLLRADGIPESGELFVLADDQSTYDKR